LLLACVALLVMVVQGRAINAAVGSGIELSSTSFASVVPGRFQEHAMRYASIPVVAGLLNWATNFLAVKMIFYPINFVGLKFRTWPEQPFGLIGWTGIVPVKAASMASRMVRMVKPRNPVTQFELWVMVHNLPREGHVDAAGREQGRKTCLCTPTC